MTSYTAVLSEAEADRLERHLRGHDFAFRTVPHARFAAERDRTNVVYYASGKLVVQGRGTQEFVEFVLEPQILRRAVVGYESVLNPDLLLPRIGIDESGKGDFFGPLCVAGVYVNAGIVAKWTEAGVRDSKAIGSDRRIKELAELIRATPGAAVEVVAIGNEAYNRLHLSLRNVNSILAWGHARVLENLLRRMPTMKPPPVRAVSDQFAASKRTVERALMELGRQIELVQRHKAESDLAVAAASIVARHEFVRRLAALGRELELELPKGAGATANEAAVRLVERHGVGALRRAAKLHFRNARAFDRNSGEKPDEAAEG
ncbi:MAG: ribonuclease HIII [Verrucomicrobia bacterium]|nr:ribonuclease HIII [Verrucomicrobiota bacterium]